MNIFARRQHPNPFGYLDPPKKREASFFDATRQLVNSLPARSDTFRTVDDQKVVDKPDL